MINKIDHINISVHDLEKSKEFYMNLLGFELEVEGEFEGDQMDVTMGLKNVRAKCAKLCILNTETSLELIHYYNSVGEIDPQIYDADKIGIRHITIKVKGIDEIYQKLKNKGVNVFSDLQKYKVNKKLCYFLGTDNEILELAEYS